MCKLAACINRGSRNCFTLQGAEPTKDRTHEKVDKRQESKRGGHRGNGVCKGFRHQAAGAYLLATRRLLLLLRLAGCHALPPRRVDVAHYNVTGADALDRALKGVPQLHNRLIAIQKVDKTCLA